MELLVPAGNMESLYAAINYGADAVYLAGKNFGARSFAPNFSQEELRKAIRLGKLYGVKIYITMNTLVKETEVAAFLQQVEFLYQNHVDAIIMQDFGMMCLCRTKYPQLEIHASTQCNSSSIETIELFHKLGIKRVVLPREMSIEEIKQIKVPIEKEIFIHGALCVSYSGCCLLSQVIGGRSGNRGQCAGPCRLFYQLYEGKEKLKEGYLLSMKELNTSHFLKNLPQDICSLKIEGRMKSATYVGFITAYYRRLLDNKPLDVKLEDTLKSLFYRGFTKGHLWDDAQLINRDSPNHIGLRIGQVIKVTKERIYLRLTKELQQGDGIRFMPSQQGFIVNFLYNQQGKLIHQAQAQQVIEVDNKIDLQTLDAVHKTSNSALPIVTDTILKKIPLTITCHAQKYRPLSIVFTDDLGNCVTYQGQEVAKATTSALSKERISQQLTKLGTSPFCCQHIEITKDEDIFIRMGELNIARRTLCERLLGKRKENANDVPIITPTFKKITSANKLEIKDYQKIIRNPLHLGCHLQEKSLVSQVFDARGYDVIGGYALNVYNSYTAYYLYQLGFQALTLSVELTAKELQEVITATRAKFGLIPLLIKTEGVIEVMIIKGNILEISPHKTYSLVNQKQTSFQVIYDGFVTHLYAPMKEKIDLNQFPFEELYASSEVEISL